MEYACDVAQACHERGIKTVAVTAGYICAEPREQLFQHMDAANVDLKAFSEEFYSSITSGHLDPVLETLAYLKSETEVWFEITTLLIPGENDSEAEIEALSQWIVEHVGPDVPLHFTAFHPDWKMLDKSPTPFQTLERARRIALQNGVRYCYTGKRPRPERPEHLLSSVRPAPDRPQLVCAGKLAPDPRRLLPEVRSSLCRCLRRASGELGIQAHAGQTDCHVRTA